MKKVQHIWSVLMTVVLVLSLNPCTVWATEALDKTETLEVSAESQNTRKTLKSAGAKFDLKRDKAIDIGMYSKGGVIHYSATLSNVKQTKTAKGKKRLTFTITTKLKSLTKRQRNSILKAYVRGESVKNVFGDLYCVLVDYNTGQMLYDGNKFNVKHKVNTYKGTQTKVYWNDTKCDGFRTQKSCKLTMTVTCPASYKGLCVGIGGSTYPKGKANKAQQLYSKSKTTNFYATNMYKKDKSRFHFIRIK